MLEIEAGQRRVAVEPCKDGVAQLVEEGRHIIQTGAKQAERKSLRPVPVAAEYP